MTTPSPLTEKEVKFLTDPDVEGSSYICFEKEDLLSALALLKEKQRKRMKEFDSYLVKNFKISNAQAGVIASFIYFGLHDDIDECFQISGEKK